MKWLAARFLKWRGWEFTGEIPNVPRLVIIGAPHTSNWDFVVFLGALHHYRVKMRFIGKQGLFRWPFGYLFRRWGGIPVDRTRPGGVVNQVVATMDQTDRVILAVAPEGTRKAAPYWKAGFLAIARKSGAPILLAYIDFKHRKAGMGPILDAEDPEAVMETARSFYADKVGRHPEGMGPVQLKADWQAHSR